MEQYFSYNQDENNKTNTQNYIYNAQNYIYNTQNYIYNAQNYIYNAQKLRIDGTTILHCHALEKNGELGDDKKTNMCSDFNASTLFRNVQNRFLLYKECGTTIW